VRRLGFTILLIAAAGRAQIAPCFAGFEISRACIAGRGLEPKAAVYRHKIAEALWTLGASYKIDLRLVNHPVEGGYNASESGDVFTEVVRDEEMRNESFVINVTADFLERQPETLFESSALHEVCHVMNDDLTGYHRNGANIEAAEEACVLRAVGEERYRQYLRAYAAYQHWDSTTYEQVLRKVKGVALVPAPDESDEADRIASDYFRKHADGEEHLLVYNGELHDITLRSTGDRVWHDPEKLKAVLLAGRPMVFFHNHPAGPGRAAMFPSYEDFGAAGFFSFMAYAEHPDVPVEFRVVQPGKETTTVAYGFKGVAAEDIRKLSSEYRKAATLRAELGPIEMRLRLLDSRLARESFSEYLQFACPVDLERKDAEVCRTHPQYFIWPSERFFVHYRRQ
jgi:hypothetical protein